MSDFKCDFEIYGLSATFDIIKDEEEGLDQLVIKVLNPEIKNAIINGRGNGNKYFFSGMHKNHSKTFQEWMKKELNDSVTENDFTPRESENIFTPEDVE